MAKAELVVTQEIVQTTKDVTNVQLTVSKEEAALLLTLLRRTGGPPTDSPREYADSVHSALLDAGISEPDGWSELVGYHRCGELASCDIYFNSFKA